MEESNYQRIKKACLAHLETGGRVVRGTFGFVDPDGVDCKCAVSCFTLNDIDDDGGSDLIGKTAASLGVTAEEVWKFILGFDTDHTLPADCDSYVASGRRLKSELGL